MARLIYSVRALADLERLTDFLIDSAPRPTPYVGRPPRGMSKVAKPHLLMSDPKAALKTVGLIEEAVELLERHPMIGRPVEPPLRELVISRGKSGYLALYSFESVDDAVLILAIRHQRELGYDEDAMS